MMKIEVQDKPAGIPFSQVGIGEAFKWDNAYYLRIDAESFDAVNLGTCTVCGFAGATMVEPVDAKLVISEQEGEK